MLVYHHAGELGCQGHLPPTRSGTKTNAGDKCYCCVFFLQVLLVIGGEAPKAIRSVEFYDFKEEEWYQVAEMPSRRCRCGR